MAAADGDGQSFRVNFTGDGVALLKERVKDKLTEFMGDYTDDTLAEYVVVLLRNGRRKDEARNELNVFLGDDCVSFVAWLWDHLSSNLHLYAQAKEPSSNQVGNTKPRKVTLSGKNMHAEHVNGSTHMDSEYDRPRPTNVSRHQRNNELEGLGREEAHSYSLRSVVSEDFHPEKKNNHRPAFARESRSPSPHIHRKRSRQDELQTSKRALASHGMIDAPRRILQFAVRDAVRTVQQTSPRTVPSSKRLRSVVSTATNDSHLEERPLITSIPRASDFVGVPPKAAAEAAEDVRKVRNPGNVFDRLHIAKGASINQSPDHGGQVLQREHDHFGHIPEANSSNFSRNGHYTQEFVRDARDYEMARDSASYNDRYEDVSISSHRGLDVPLSASARKVRDKPITQHRVTPDADEVARRTGSMDHGSQASVPRKIVNIAVNVNTWKPPHHENKQSVIKEGIHIAPKKVDVDVGKTSMQLPEDVAPSDSQKGVQKSVTSTPGRPDDDVDSRILFVSNVHFAATKDTLSRHFNRFGEVAKVIIATDAATGQPKGSAYVEFLQKEAAEDALSVNGTSFMSRILKVVRRSSAQHESSQITRRPGMVHASPYSSIPRIPYPRGPITGHFRGHLPMRPGGRSLQWKREAPNTQTTEGLKTPQNAPVTPVKPMPASRGRSLTYVRPGLKVESVSDVPSLN